MKEETEESLASPLKLAKGLEYMDRGNLIRIILEGQGDMNIN